MLAALPSEERGGRRGWRGETPTGCTGPRDAHHGLKKSRSAGSPGLAHLYTPGPGAAGPLPGGANGDGSSVRASPSASKVSSRTEGSGTDWLLFSRGPEASARPPPRSVGRGRV